MQPRIIFLDVDGVLNHTAWHQVVAAGGQPWTKDRHWDRQIDPACVARVLRLVEATDADIVLSSTWRGMSDPEKALSRAGLSWIDRTPRSVRHRGHEIAAWMRSHGGVTADRIVILDDDGDMAHLLPRLVQTDRAVGLTDADVERAIALLGCPVRPTNPG